MKLYFLLLFFVAANSNGQSELCNYLTDGSGNSHGLKIRVKIPCSWRSEVNNLPNTIITSTNDLGLVQNLVIKKMPTVFPQAEVREIYTIEGMKMFTGGVVNVKSVRKIIINGIEAAEAEIFNEVETAIGKTYVKGFWYLIIYKDYMIVLTYSSLATSEDLAATLFQNNKLFFKILANGTAILNQWK